MEKFGHLIASPSSIYLYNKKFMLYGKAKKALAIGASSLDAICANYGKVGFYRKYRNASPLFTNMAKE